MQLAALAILSRSGVTALINRLPILYQSLILRLHNLPTQEHKMTVEWCE